MADQTPPRNGNGRESLSFSLGGRSVAVQAANLTTILLLTLPMAEARGFQTPDYSGSRGPVQARAGSRMASTPEARVQHLPAATRVATAEADTPCAGVDCKRITCMFRALPLVVRLLALSHRGGIHPLRLTELVWQQIKKLTVWRSTFYAQDFPAQPPMSSIKELRKVYQSIPHRNSLQRLNRLEKNLQQTLFGLQPNACVTPCLKSGGCASGPLMQACAEGK